MELALLIASAVIVFLIILNGYLNGAMKVRIDAVLSMIWLVLLALAFLVFDWKVGVTAIAVSLIAAWLLQPAARRTAAFIYAHPPRR